MERTPHVENQYGYVPLDHEEMLETETKDGKVLELQTDTVGVLPDTKDEKPFEDLTEESDSKSLLRVRLILLTFGISSLLPWNVILNAAGYFMVRLEGSRFENTFSYYIQATAIFCNLIGGCGNLYLDKKFDTRKLALISNITMTAPLIVMTVLAKINTDTWPETFFILNMVCFGVNAASHGVCTSAQSALSTMISPEVLKDYYIGKGLAGLVASAVTIITLSFPSLDAETAAFYYFLVVTIATLVGTTTLTYYFINMDLVKDRTKAKKYVNDSNGEPVKEETLPMMELLKLITVPCVTALVLTISTLIVFPAILTTLKPIKSEPKSDWTEKYFLPVTVYLMFALGDFLGKMVSGFVSWPGKETIVYVASARLFLIPLTLMTNIQPRTLPVWFKNDVVPSIFSFLTAFTGGYLMNLCLAYAPTYVEGNQNKGRVSVIVFGFICVGLATGSVCIFAVPPILNAY